MGKIFRINTIASKEQNESLKSFSFVYKIFYNKALEIQLNNRNRVNTREEQFMSLEDMDIQVNKLNLKFPFKFDMGIRASALIHAQKAFYTWWDLYLTNPKKPSIGESPRFIGGERAKEIPFFFTETHWKVDKNGLYVPNLGYVKFKEKNYVPFGEFKNIKLTWEKKFWKIQLEANFEIAVEPIIPKIENLDVSIYPDGSFLIGELEIPSVLDAESMLTRLERYEEAEKQLKRKIELSRGIPENKKPKSILKAKKELSRAKDSIENEKIRLYNSLVNMILKEAPAKIKLTAPLTNRGEEQFFSNNIFRQTKMKMFVRMLKKKVELYGIKVETEGIKPEIFY